MMKLARFMEDSFFLWKSWWRWTKYWQNGVTCWLQYLGHFFLARLSWIHLFCYWWIVSSWRRSIVTDGGCKRRDNQDQHSAHETRHLTSECARSFHVSPCCLHTHSLHKISRGSRVRVFALITSMHEASVTLRLWAVHSIRLPLLIHFESPAVLASLELPRGRTRSNTAYSANKEMGWTDESYSRSDILSPRYQGLRTGQEKEGESGCQDGCYRCGAQEQCQVNGPMCICGFCQAPGLWCQIEGSSAWSFHNSPRDRRPPSKRPKLPSWCMAARGLCWQSLASLEGNRSSGSSSQKGRSRTRLTRRSADMTMEATAHFHRCRLDENICFHKQRVWRIKNLIPWTDDVNQARCVFSFSWSVFSLPFHVSSHVTEHQRRERRPRMTEENLEEMEIEGEFKATERAQFLEREMHGPV